MESVPEPEDSSPVLTWILGYFWSLPGESVIVASVACPCAFLPSYSSSVTLPFAWIQGSVAFSVGFPTSNSHGDGPFLRALERVPEVPVVSREHLAQLEKIQEVLPSKR